MTVGHPSHHCLFITNYLIQLQFSQRRMDETHIYYLSQIRDIKFYKATLSQLDIKLTNGLDQFEDNKEDNTYSKQNSYNIIYMNLRVEHIKLAIYYWLIGFGVAFLYLIFEVVFCKINHN